MSVSVCGLDVYFGVTTHSECKDSDLAHSSCAYSVDFAVFYAIRIRLTPFLLCYESSGLKKRGEEKEKKTDAHIYSCLSCFISSKGVFIS